MSDTLCKLCHNVHGGDHMLLSADHVWNSEQERLEALLRARDAANAAKQEILRLLGRK